MRDMTTADDTDSDTPIAVTDLWADRRQAERLKQGTPVKFGDHTIPANLLVDLAAGLNDDPCELFRQYGVPDSAAAEVVDHPDFGRIVSELHESFRADGTTFRVKSRLLATAFLEHAAEIVTDATAPAQVRATLIQWIAKMGDLEPAPKERVGGSGPGGSTVNLSITLLDPAGRKRPALTVENDAAQVADAN